MLTGVAGYPSRNLRQFTDAAEESTANVLGVAGSSVEKHGLVKLSHRGIEEIPSGDDVIRKSQTVGTGDKVGGFHGADAAACCSRRGCELISFGGQEEGDGLGGASALKGSVVAPCVGCRAF